MKIILTQKVTKLGNMGDTVVVKTGFARNYLLPNGKAMRWTRENVAVFKAKKAELQARQTAAKKAAESKVDAVRNAKFYMIRQAGDTGQLYGSVSTRDIARKLKELADITIESAQVLLGTPIKSVGTFDTQIALHPDVVVPIKVYVAPTQDEIDALVAGKVLVFGNKKTGEERETPVEEEPVAKKVIKKSQPKRAAAKKSTSKKAEPKKVEPEKTETEQPVKEEVKKSAKPGVKKTVAKKAESKKSEATEKKSAAKPKKETAKKPATAKKEATKKEPVKKAAVKKTAAKKETTKKVAAKKSK